MCLLRKKSLVCEAMLMSLHSHNMSQTAVDKVREDIAQLHGHLCPTIETINNKRAQQKGIAVKLPKMRLEQMKDKMYEIGVALKNCVKTEQASHVSEQHFVCVQDDEVRLDIADFELCWRK